MEAGTSAHLSLEFNISKMRFIIFILLFLLSWLGGIFILLLAAFFSYEFLSVVDITSFAVFLLAGCLILLPGIYLPVLKLMTPGIKNNQILYFPALLALIANLPVYFLIWLKTYDLYGKTEAILFYIAVLTIGVIFGTGWAWKRKKMDEARSGITLSRQKSGFQS